MVVTWFWAGMYAVEVDAPEHGQARMCLYVLSTDYRPFLISVLSGVVMSGVFLYCICRVEKVCSINHKGKTHGDRTD